MGRSGRVVRSLAIGLGVGGALFSAAALASRWEERHPIDPERLASPDSQFMDVSGLRVHLIVAGSGSPALVLQHGALASLATWRGALPYLAERGTVLAFDRPGAGLTSRPLPGEWVGANPYTPEASADLTIALLNRLGIERAVMVGHSAGAAVALRTALRHPDRVQALVLISPALTLPGSLPAPVGALLRATPLRPALPLGLRAGAMIGGAVLRRSVYNPATVTPEMVRTYRSLIGLEHWDRALLELVLAQHPLAIDGRLRALMMPALVIVGDHDRLIGTADGIELAEMLPNARLVTLPDTGHIPQEEDPAMFAALLDGFLERLPAREAAPV